MYYRLNLIAPSDHATIQEGALLHGPRTPPTCSSKAASG